MQHYVEQVKQKKGIFIKQNKHRKRKTIQRKELTNLKALRQANQHKAYAVSFPIPSTVAQGMLQQCLLGETSWVCPSG